MSLIADKLIEIRKLRVRKELYKRNLAFWDLLMADHPSGLSETEKAERDLEFYGFININKQIKEVWKDGL